MGDSKNHLYSKEDYQKDQQENAKRKTQQQFSRFSISAATSLNDAGNTQAPEAMQIDTRNSWFREINDTFDPLSLVTVDVFFGTDPSGDRNYVTYNIVTVEDDITFAFSGTPYGKMLPFTLDITIDKPSDPRPIITWPASLINPPSLPPLTDGLRIILHFETVRDAVSERQHYIGGTAGTGIQDPIILNSHDDTPLAGPGFSLDWSLANHHFTRTVSGDVAITMINFPTSSKYQPLILQLKMDGTGLHDVTFNDSFLNIPSSSLFVDPQPNAVTTLVFHTDGDGNILAYNTVAEDAIPNDMSDELTELALASSVTPFYEFYSDYAFYVTEVIISVRTPGTGAAGIEVDVKKNGTTIFSTRPTIDNGDNLSTEGAPLSVISTPQILKNDKIGLFLTIRDTNNDATGLKCKLIGVKK